MKSNSSIVASLLAATAFFNLVATHAADTTPAEHKTRIVLVGDSTVTDSAGWGLGFKRSITDKVELINSYLNIIREFQPLPLFMQLNLMRPENFDMVHGELKHRVILIVADVDFDFLPSPTQVRRTISRDR